MTGISSGGGGGYDYVETFFPSDAEEGEDLYHLTKDAAFVYDGAEWIEQTVTDHSQLSGVNAGDHRSDSQVSDLAPVQSVNGRTGAVTGLFEASNYTPETDTHDRYTDSEAASAAPVQSVDGKTGDVTTVPSGVITMWSGSVTNVPAGWTLCDGSNGAPDLQDRFIVGAGSQYSTGATGGSDSVSLSVSQLPSHSHDYSRYAGAKQYNTAGNTNHGDNTENYGTQTTSATGGGEAHENRPPFYALAFIMKT
jgi:microcystin-dependent protein